MGPELDDGASSVSVGETKEAKREGSTRRNRHHHLAAMAVVASAASFGHEAWLDERNLRMREKNVRWRRQTEPLSLRDKRTISMKALVYYLELGLSTGQVGYL
jgi:hypothetical protein